MNTQSLFEQQVAIAEEYYQNYDFGSIVEDSSGWEGLSPGDELSRPVFLENEDPHQPSERVRFVVRFKDEQSIEVQEAYAINSKGSIFGGCAAAASA